MCVCVSLLGIRAAGHAVLTIENDGSVMRKEHHSGHHGQLNQPSLSAGGWSELSCSRPLLRQEDPCLYVQPGHTIVKTRCGINGQDKCLKDGQCVDDSSCTANGGHVCNQTFWDHLCEGVNGRCGFLPSGQDKCLKNGQCVDDSSCTDNGGHVCNQAFWDIRMKCKAARKCGEATDSYWPKYCSENSKDKCGAKTDTRCGYLADPNKHMCWKQVASSSSSSEPRWECVEDSYWGECGEDGGWECTQGFWDALMGCKGKCEE